MDELFLKFGGVFHLLLIAFHLFFWKLFNWKKELKRVSHINRGAMQVMNIKLIFVFLLFGFLSFFYFDELLNTQLGNVLLIAISAFWLFRAVEQLIFFKPSSKSIGLMLFFFIGFVLYFIPLV